MEKELKEYLDENFARLASKGELNDLEGDVRGIEEVSFIKFTSLLRA